MDNQLSYKKEVAKIHFISNSSMLFYREMRNNYYVNTILANESTQSLIEKFKEVASTASNSLEIANAYAIFIALTFKNDSKDFFKEALNIKFEWFSIIANYYLTGNTPPPQINNINDIGFITDSETSNFVVL